MAAGQQFTIAVWALAVDNLAGFNIKYEIDGAGVRVDDMQLGAWPSSAGGVPEFLHDVAQSTATCSLRAATAQNSPDGQGVICRLLCTALSAGAGADTVIDLSAPAGLDPGTRFAHPNPEGNPIYSDPVRRGAKVTVTP